MARIQKEERLHNRKVLESQKEDLWNLVLDQTYFSCQFDQKVGSRFCARPAWLWVENQRHVLGYEVIKQVETS